jgi:hypothetical protein
VYLVLDVNTICYEITVGIKGATRIFYHGGGGGSLFRKGATRKFADRHLSRLKLFLPFFKILLSVIINIWYSPFSFEL